MRSGLSLVLEAIPDSGATAERARSWGRAKLSLDLHRFGNLPAAIFFGFWPLPLGLLVFRSGFLPRLLVKGVTVGQWERGALESA